MPISERFKHYKTGVIEIDHQHRSLLNIIASIKSAIKSKDTFLATKHTMEFCNAMERHLQYEEDLMESFDYKFFKAHLANHDSIKTRLSSIKNKSLAQGMFYDISEMERALYDDIDQSDIQMCNEYIKYSQGNY